MTAVRDEEAIGARHLPLVALLAVVHALELQATALHQRLPGGLNGLRAHQGAVAVGPRSAQAQCGVGGQTRGVGAASQRHQGDALRVARTEVGRAGGAGPHQAGDQGPE